MSDQDYKKLATKYKKALQKLSDTVLIHLWALDEEMRKPSTPERGSRIAKLSNYLDKENDLKRYCELGVDFHKDDKDKYVSKLVKKARGRHE